MAKILVTHSYFLSFDPKQMKIGQPFAPLGTLYAVAMLRDKKYDVAFHDVMFSENADEILPVLKKHSPAIFVIYDDGFNYLSKMCLSNMRLAAFRMILLAKQNGCTVVVCSSDAMDNYQTYLGKGADFIITGEGEVTLQELVARIMMGNPISYDDIRGIAWNKDDRYVVNKPRELITNPDDLPFPAWEMLDVEKYRETWMKKNGYFTMNMVTTRGCPYNCIWCAKPIYGNHYNSRSPQNVVAEMAFLKQRYAPGALWFADDIFALKPGWINEFSKEVEAKNCRIPYTIQTRVDLLLNQDQVAPLAASGCRKVWLGIESGSQKILDAMNKGITVEQMRLASPKLRDAGISQAFFLQLGFPGEDREDIRKTLRILTDLMPDDIGISVTYPLPGTRFYDAVKKELEEKKNWTDSDDLSLMFKSNFSAIWYKWLHRYIHKYYRFRQGIYFLRNSPPVSGKRVKNIRRILLIPYYLLFALIYRLLLSMTGNK